MAIDTLLAAAGRNATGEVITVVAVVGAGALLLLAIILIWVGIIRWVLRIDTIVANQEAILAANRSTGHPAPLPPTAPREAPIAPTGRDGAILRAYGGSADA